MARAIDDHVWYTGFAWGAFRRRFRMGEVNPTPEERAEIQRREEKDAAYWSSLLPRHDISDGRDYRD